LKQRDVLAVSKMFGV